jgi:hypothetical protein
MINREVQRKKQADWSKKERRSYDGYLRSIYRSACERVATRKTTAQHITFTLGELKKHARLRTQYPKLHEAWVKSGYDTRLSPSIDRIDNTGDYSLDNVQFITKSQNAAKGRGPNSKVVATVERWKAIDYTSVYNITTIKRIPAGALLIFDSATNIIKIDYSFCPCS